MSSLRVHLIWAWKQKSTEHLGVKIIYILMCNMYKMFCTVIVFK